MDGSCRCSGKRKRGHQHQHQQEQMSNMSINGSIEPDALDCPVCMYPLQPPVLQCAVGHVICSSCHGKLINKDNCNVCSHTGGYRRCNAFDKILESLHIPCANTAYGCTTKTQYHKVEEHHKSCLHAPCFCPEPGCSFDGSSTVSLLEHLTGHHMWPSTELETMLSSPWMLRQEESMFSTAEPAPLFSWLSSLRCRLMATPPQSCA